MAVRSSCLGGTVLGLFIVGCTSSATQKPAIQGQQGVVSGTATYRERVALPTDAVLEVWITDVSPLILAVPIIAETTVRSEGRQVPLPFELRYDPSRIEPDHLYAVKAAIRSGGRLLFATEKDQQVITKGNPTRVDLLLVRPAEPPGSGAGGMAGTKWRLEDLAGTGVLDRVEATLEFAEEGKVAGGGSCNRFFGTVQISGDAITFGPLGSTRMACAEAVATQEARYLKALQDAERFALKGSVLLIYSKGVEKPLRFVRKDP